MDGQSLSYTTNSDVQEVTTLLKGYPHPVETPVLPSIDGKVSLGTDAKTGVSVPSTVTSAAGAIVSGVVEC